LLVLIVTMRGVLSEINNTRSDFQIAKLVSDRSVQRQAKVMTTSIEDQVIDFHRDLFGNCFLTDSAIK
jgi:hypothetical protein